LPINRSEKIIPMRLLVAKSICSVAFAILIASCNTNSPIGRHPDNPHYFIFKGKPIVLITTDQHYGAVINLDFDYIPFLDRLQEYGMNLTRIFPGGYIEIKDMYTKGNPLGPAPDRFILPWKKSGEEGANPNLGKYKYDLDNWDNNYFKRLKDFVSQASQRNIIVEIAFFNGMYDDRWMAQPLYHTNNIQNAGTCEYMLFTTLTDKKLAEYQVKYVKKIAAEMYESDNVIYDISDEPEMQHRQSHDWNSALLDALISVDHYRHMYGETANSASPDFTGDNRISWIPTEYISPMENTLDNDYTDNKPVVDVETAYYSYWYGANPVEESRAESWYGMLGGLAGFIQLNSDFSTYNPSGKGTGTQDTILPQKRVLMNFMNSLDFIKMQKFTDFRISDSQLLVRGIAEEGKQYALYLFHGTRKWEDWPQGSTASRFNVDMNWFRDTINIKVVPGTYKVEWVNPASGFIIESKEQEFKAENIYLPTPKYLTDITLRIKRI
jgi:hypothetical protein